MVQISQPIENNTMKTGQIVITKFGEGRLIKKESPIGIFAHRWLVKINYLTGPLKAMQDRQKGLYIMDDEMEVKSPIFAGKNVTK